MTPSPLNVTMLAAATTTEEPSFLQSCFGFLVLIAIVGFFVRGSYRDHVAAGEARDRAKSLSHSERDVVERQILDIVFQGYDHTLSIRELVSRMGEHEQYVLCVVAPLIKWNLLDVVSLADGTPDPDFNLYSTVAVTAEGDKRLKERDPVVTYNEFISVGDHSNVVNKSVIVNSNVGAYQSRYGTDTVEALRELEQIVRSSNDEEAVEALDGFLAEARAENPSKTRMRIFFSSIQHMVPALSGAADVVSKITGMFA